MTGLLLWASLALASGDGKLELGLWHGAAGAALGLGVDEIAGIEGPSRAVAPIALGAVGLSSLAWTPDLTTGRAMNIESGELLGAGVVSALSVTANLAPELTIAGAAVGAVGGGIIGSQIGDTDPNKHALVRSTALWGLYYADLSYGLVPVETTGFYRPYRYVAGVLGGAAIGLVVPGTPTRLQTNLVSGVGFAAAGATVLATPGLNRDSRTIALAAVPLVSAGAAAAVVVLAGQRSSSADLLIVPQLDPRTGHRGIRLVLRRW